MRLLKTIGIQTTIFIGTLLILEMARFLIKGEFDLKLSQLSPWFIFFLMITLSSLIWDRPIVKTFAETDQNRKAIEDWLTKLSAKEVESQGGTLRYQVSYFKSFDRDLTVTTQNNSIRVEGILRLLRSLPDSE